MINVKRISHATFETPDLDRQIAYFTETAGLALAERENGRAFLATKLGDLAIQLEKGEHARCARLAFQVAPDTEFDDIRRGVEAEGLRCQTRNDPTPGIPRMLAFEDPKGTVCELFAAQTPIGKNRPVAGIGPMKLGHLAFVVPEVTEPRRQTAAWYLWWVGAETGHLRREAMVSRQHYMLNQFTDFDVPLDIVPPEDDATPPVGTPAA